MTAELTLAGGPLTEGGTKKESATSRRFRRDREFPSSRVDRQAAALFLIAPISAVSIAPPAPPAIACETMAPTLRLPDCTAVMIDGSNNVTIWPSTPQPTRPETMLPTVPRSNVGDDLPAPTPPSAPATRLIKICSMSISARLATNGPDLA